MPARCRLTLTSGLSLTPNLSDFEYVRLNAYISGVIDNSVSHLLRETYLVHLVCA